jgi:hypothetical protein
VGGVEVVRFPVAVAKVAEALAAEQAANAGVVEKDPTAREAGVRKSWVVKRAVDSLELELSMVGVCTVVRDLDEANLLLLSSRLQSAARAAEHLQLIIRGLGPRVAGREVLPPQVPSSPDSTFDSFRQMG